MPDRYDLRVQPPKTDTDVLDRVATYFARPAIQRSAVEAESLLRECAAELVRARPARWCSACGLIRLDANAGTECPTCAAGRRPPSRWERFVARLLGEGGADVIEDLGSAVLRLIARHVLTGAAVVAVVVGLLWWLL